MNTDLANKYCAELEKCVETNDKSKADSLLCDLLTIFGYRSVCEVYSRVQDSLPAIEAPVVEDSPVEPMSKTYKSKGNK